MKIVRRPAPGRVLVRRLWPILILAGVFASACRTPDPQKEIGLADLEAYWIVDVPEKGEQYIAPAVRFILRNKGEDVAHSLQAKATFRREGQEWGGDWRRVTATGGKALRPGEDAVVVLRSEARYHTPGTPESMFSHAQFKDATVDVFLRLGSSPWTKFGELTVERRIGSKTVAAEAR